MDSGGSKVSFSRLGGNDSNGGVGNGNLTYHSCANENPEITVRPDQLFTATIARPFRRTTLLDDFYQTESF